MAAVLGVPIPLMHLWLANHDDVGIHADRQHLVLDEVLGGERASHGKHARALGRPESGIPPADELVAAQAHNYVGALIGKQMLARPREADAAASSISGRHPLRGHGADGRLSGPPLRCGLLLHGLRRRGGGRHRLTGTR